MPIKFISILGYVLFAITLVLLYISTQQPPKRIIEIRTEIHRIQSVRKEQSRKADSSVESNTKRASARISNLKKYTNPELIETFEKEFVPVDTNIIQVSRNQIEKCLEYKYKYESDSSSLVIMTNDRNTCNDQLDSIVKKADTIVIEAEKDSKRQYRRGLFNGIISGAIIVGVVLLQLLLAK